MKKLMVLLALLMFCSSVFAYDLETLIGAKNRWVEITLKDGTKCDGLVWDVIKVVEDDSREDKVVSYKILSDDIGKIKVQGTELQSNTRVKYYLIIRKGVVEYQLDSDSIALLGVQKW